MNTDEMVANVTKHLFGTWNKQKAFKSPLFVADAEGVYFYDAKRKPYLDFTSQFMCSNLGHKNRAVIEALKQQAEKLAYVAPAFVNEATCRAVEALTTVMPDRMAKYFFSTAGTEANEAALFMTRQVKNPAHKIISRYHSYHGSTAGSISCTGDPRGWAAERFQCKIPGVRFAPDCYCYRCPFEAKYPECNVQCAGYMDYMIREEGNVAAIILETIAGANGRLVPPPEYLPKIRRICDEHGVLLILDEVMTGWFRTGRTFAMDHWGVQPDIMTTAKGCSAAYTPVAITAASQSIADYFEENILFHGHTYSCHPMVMSVIPTVIDEYKKLNASGLPERVSSHLKQGLHRLAEKHECIGDVRGLGHFYALELVKNRKTKAPFNTKAERFDGQTVMMTAKIAGACMQKGLWLMPWYDALMISPPLIITEEQVDEGLAILDKELEIADREVQSTGVAFATSSEFGQG